VSGSAVQIRQSVADNYGITMDCSTTDTGLGGGALLAIGSSIDVNGNKIILGNYAVNYADANTGLTVQNKVEINNNAILIGQYVSTLTSGTTTSTFNGWTFSSTGTLTLPQGGVIDEGNSPTGVGKNITLKPQGGSSTQALVIYPTAGGDGDHIHLTAGGGSTELYLGDDNQYVKLVNGGNIQVRAATADSTATAVWTFGTNGTVLFPDAAIDGGTAPIELKSRSWSQLTYNNTDMTPAPNKNHSTTFYVEGGDALLEIFRWDASSVLQHQQWTFSSDGSLTFPNNTIQTTAWTPSNVLQDVTFSGNVTFNSSSTYVLSSNTVYTDNIIELHYTSTWAVNDGKDIGLRFHYYDTQDRNAFFGRDNTTGYLEWLVNSSADNINNVTGTDGTFRLGSIILRDTTVSNSTNTGALTVTGGVGVNGGVFVGGTVTATNFILNGYQVSTSTGGITSPYAGIFTSTNTSSAVSTTTGALQVAGGVGIGGGVFIGGTVTATTFTGLASAGTTATTAAALGYMGMPQNSTATSYTLVAGDQGRHVYITATGQTITVPANSTTAFPIGTTIVIIAGPSATSTTIAITTDTMYLGGTGTTGSRTLAAYGMATLVKVAATTWFINGSGLT